MEISKPSMLGHCLQFSHVSYKIANLTGRAGQSLLTCTVFAIILGVEHFTIHSHVSYNFENLTGRAGHSKVDMYSICVMFRINLRTQLAGLVNHC